MYRWRKGWGRSAAAWGGWVCQCVCVWQGKVEGEWLSAVWLAVIVCAVIVYVYVVMVWLAFGVKVCGIVPSVAAQVWFPAPLVSDLPQSQKQLSFVKRVWKCSSILNPSIVPREAWNIAPASITWVSAKDQSGDKLWLSVRHWCNKPLEPVVFSLSGQAT